MNFSIYIPEIRFADIDAMGHVNNAVYFVYCEQARIEFFKQVITGEWNWHQHGILVARNEMNYRKPILLTDHIEVRTKCSHIGNKSFTLMYEFIRGNEVCAAGLSVLVCFDYQSKSTIAVPEVWQTGLRKMFIETPEP